MPSDQQQQRQARNRAEANRRIASPPPHHSCVLAPAPETSGVTADGDAFALSAADRKTFEASGFVILRGVMTDAELKREVDPVFFGFFNGEPRHVAPGKDTSDMGYPPSSSLSRAAGATEPGAPSPSRPPRAEDCCST